MARRRAVRLGQHLVRLRELRRVDVAERPHLRVGRIELAEQHAPLAADADERRRAPARPAPARSAPRPRRGRQRRRARDHLQEVAAADRLLFGSEVHEASTITEG